MEPASLNTMGKVCSFPRGIEAGVLPSTSADIRNEHSHTCTPVCLHGKHKDNLIFTLHDELYIYDIFIRVFGLGWHYALIIE